MRSRSLSYNDAVKLLGGESKVLTALSRLAGVGLTVATAGGNDVALGLFDLKSEVNELGKSTYSALHSRIHGLTRFKRSELLEAAHAVIVIVAFFAGLDDLDDELRTALNTASLEVTKVEQAALATDSNGESGRNGLADIADKLTKPNVIPGLISSGGQITSLGEFYQAFASRLLKFAQGTAAWDRVDETTRDRWVAVIKEALPRAAAMRYEEQLRRLASDFPEVAFWAHRVGVKGILRELDYIASNTSKTANAVGDLSNLMGQMVQGRRPDLIRAELAKSYQAHLDGLIGGAEEDALPDGVTLPTLRGIYVNPSYRMLPLASTGSERAEWISEPAWEMPKRSDDLWSLMAEHLISTQATEAPMVVLGQPGAGKSLFTQILAAELDPRDFLVVRVELRAVPADADVQRQIEAALHGLTGRSLSWPDLLANPGDAQPVVLLDGFDELLQASGVSHFNYLEEVQAFQQREKDLGRPVAVLVTSRTAVADQVRYPEGTVVIRLEEFDDDQVERWLASWNGVNPTKSLPVRLALAQGELARQPLLLFMLALFHSGGGALSSGIDQAQLYERLFSRFAERDVNKLGKQLPERERFRAVERELDQLSVVAFAMFNRGRQSVTDRDLIADLGVLPIGFDASYGSGTISSRGQLGELRRAAALDAAQRLAGRFFFRLFVQRAQATYGQQATHKVYEFLHTSFGEFLVSRWIVNELGRLARRSELAADDPCPPPIDDTLMHALLSKAVLSTREQRILAFIKGLLAARNFEELTQLRAVVAALFRDCLQPRLQDTCSEYRPVPQSAPAAYAAYSANLVLLLLLIAEVQSVLSGRAEVDGLTFSELYGSERSSSSTDERRIAWHSTTRLWHAQLTANEWDSLLRVIRLKTTITSIEESHEEVCIILWKDEDYSHEGLYEQTQLLPLTKQDEFYRGEVRARLYEPFGHASREATLLDSEPYQDACLTLFPYVDNVRPGGSEIQLGSKASAMISLLITPPECVGTGWYFETWKDLFNGTHSVQLQQARLGLGRIRDQAQRIPRKELQAISRNIETYAFANIVAYLDILALASPSQIDANDYHRLLERSGDDILSLLALHDLLQLGGTHYLISPTKEVDVGPFSSEEFVDLVGVRPPRKILKIRSAARLTGLAVWSGFAERVALEAKPNEVTLSPQEAQQLEMASPTFIARTRHLAAKHGYSDPINIRPRSDA